MLPTSSMPPSTSSDNSAFLLSDLTLSTPTSSSPPSTLPLPPAPDAPQAHVQRQAEGRTTRLARWGSLEFRVYELGVLAGLGMVGWTAVGLGPGHPNYERFAGRLSDGWIGGRQVDLTDPQYLSFRSHLPALVLLASAHLVLRHFLFPFLSPSSSSSRPSKRPLEIFQALFSLGALSLLHGSNVLKVLALLAVNYWVVGRWAGTRWGAWVAWAFGVAVIGAVERTEGFKGWLPEALERHPGLLPRWHVSFNITALRLLSFALDRHWASLAAAASSSVAGGSEAAELSDVRDRSDKVELEPQTSSKSRTRESRPLAEYRSVVGYFAYVLYTPLYIAGPVITFNDFASQALYALRLLLSLLTMELVAHFVYVSALSSAGPDAWQGLSAGELGVLGFWGLVVVWLKLLIPWRAFRLWALLDGVDPPENMVRCVANNYSTAGFWRAWHRSYNLWVVRYIYVPLGGASNPVLSALVVFTFVALWHDLAWRLLVWGWLITAVVVPEILARRAFPSAKYADRPWFRHLVALGGTANVLAMCLANLAGFVLGLGGVRALVDAVTGSWHGISTALLSVLGTFAAVQLMVEYREEERRNGVWRRY